MTSSDLTVQLDDPARADVAALVQRHTDLMATLSPAESCHAMSGDELETRDARFFSARRDGVLLGVGALVVIAHCHGEVKSLHVTPAARGLGVGAALLQAMIANARGQGLARLSLETGATEDYAPSRALYARAGFEICPPYADYTEDPLSAFMTLKL